MVCIFFRLTSLVDGIPLESVRGDRVGDGGAVIEDSSSRIHYVNTTRDSSRLVYPTDGDGNQQHTADNYVSRHRPSHESLPLDYPTTSYTDALTFPSSTSSSFAVYDVDSSDTSGTEAASDTLPTDRPKFYLPETTTNNASTVLPFVSATTTEKPLRDRNSILIPSTDQLGRPSCLLNPTDTYCEAVSNYPK